MDTLIPKQEEEKTNLTGRNAELSRVEERIDDLCESLNPGDRVPATANILNAAFTGTAQFVASGVGKAKDGAILVKLLPRSDPGSGHRLVEVGRCMDSQEVIHKIAEEDFVIHMDVVEAGDGLVTDLAVGRICALALDFHCLKLGNLVANSAPH